MNLHEIYFIFISVDNSDAGATSKTLLDKVRIVKITGKKFPHTGYETTQFFAECLVVLPPRTLLPAIHSNILH
jgi:hypothetical protein